MKIVTFNVNGLRAILKKNFVMDFDYLDADIFALNETKISDENAFPFSKEGYFLYQESALSVVSASPAFLKLHCFTHKKYIEKQNSCQSF